MKIRVPVYLAALASLAVLTAGDASADPRIGHINATVPHRVAPSKFYSIDITKPTVSHPINITKPTVTHPIKIGRPEYQLQPRR